AFNSSVSNHSFRKSRIDIGGRRSICCIARLPRRRSRSARRNSDTPSPQLGEGRLGGVMARIGSSASANWLRNSMNRGYACASFAETEARAFAVFWTSLQMGRARPSPNATTSGSGRMNWTPRAARFRSLTTSGRSVPHTDAPVEPRKPGAISSVTTGPPTAARFSSTSTRRRTEEEQLVRGEFSVEDVPARQADHLLEVPGAQHLSVEDDLPEVRDVLLKGVEDRFPEGLASFLPRALSQGVRGVLDETRHEVLPRRRQGGIEGRRDAHVDIRSVGVVAVLRVVVSLFDVVHAWSD